MHGKRDECTPSWGREGCPQVAERFISEFAQQSRKEGSPEIAETPPGQERKVCSENTGKTVRPERD